MKRRVLLLALAAAMSVGGSPAPARQPAPASRPAASDRALIDRASTYLQGLTSAEAKFSQTDPRGAVTTGTFSLQRPGKARFAYDPPAGLTVVADGINVNVYDARLKTFDQYPLKQTPLALLLGADVRFDRGALDAQAFRDPAGFAITVRDARKRSEGQLTLRFSQAPLTLTGWTVVDGQGGKTSVTLSGLKNGVALAPGLFVLSDPHPRTFRP